MYNIVDKSMFQDDHELQFISTMDKTFRLVVGVILLSICMFPWITLSLS